MMDIEKTKVLVIEVAKAHGVYDACEDLVTEGKARWLRCGDSWECGPGPGIELKHL